MSDVLCAGMLNTAVGEKSLVGTEISVSVCEVIFPKLNFITFFCIVFGLFDLNNLRSEKHSRETL